jgi:hypothetical protein
MNNLIAIVPVRNNAEAMKGLIKHLKSKYEAILIVDDASTDTTTAILRDSWALPVSKYLPGDGFFALYHEEVLGYNKSSIDGLDMAKSAGFTIAHLYTINSQPQTYYHYKIVNLKNHNFNSWIYRFFLKWLL